MSTVTGTTHPNLRRSVARSVVGADELLGLDITDSRGERVGELWDIMLDLRTGRVAYGIVALARAPRWSERLIAVPWNAMHMDAQGDGFRIEALREWIERAPSMRPELLSNLRDREWAVLIHAYFGAKPYWEIGQHS